VSEKKNLLNILAPLANVVIRYYIIYVFRGAGLVGTRANLIASSVQYVLNVVFTIPAIIYIDKWGRRPMLLAGSFFMGFFLFLVGGLQMGYGDWGFVGDERVWLIDGTHGGVTRGIIVCSYLFVCSFAITMGPVSWTYPAEIFPLKVRGKAVSLSTAGNWIFNFALAYAVPPGFANIGPKTYFIFATFNWAMFIHFFFMYPETVGRSLEEIEQVFAQGHTFTAWKIGRDVGKRNVHEVVQANKQHGITDSDSKSEHEKA
jgi:MFS family permease